MRKKLILSLLLSPDLWKNLFFVLTSCYYSYSNLSYSRVTVDHLCRKKEFAQRHALYLLYHASGNIQTSVTPACKSINWVTSFNGKLMTKISIQKKWDVTCYTIKLLCLATVTSQAQFTCKRQDSIHDHINTPSLSVSFWKAGANQKAFYKTLSKQWQSSTLNLPNNTAPTSNWPIESLRLSPALIIKHTTLLDH